MEKLVKQIIARLTSPIGFSWPKNWVLKLLSLLFALFLWYFVAGEDKVDTNVFIPVEIVNLPREMVIANQFKKQLEVTISGPRGLISGIAKQHISRTVNMSKATLGPVVVRNDQDSIPFPRGITVLRVQPPHMTLLVDKLLEKEYPITPQTVGNPLKGFELAAVSIDPPTLSVSGPQSVLVREAEIKTSPIDISDLQESTARQVTLNISPEIADLIGEPAVTANIVIREARDDRNIAKIPIELSPQLDSDTYSMDPAHIKVKALIPLSIINSDIQLSSLFTARAILGSTAPGTYDIPVTVVPAKKVNVEIIEFFPATTTVTIKPQENQSGK